MDPLQEITAQLERLADLEAIRRLKARYCRYVDTRAWDELRGIFTDDAGFEFPRLGNFDDPASFVAACRDSFGAGTTFHHAALPELELLGDGRAAGVWAAHVDVVRPGAEGEPDRGFHGYGHYHERYRRERGEWLIRSVRLELVRSDAI